MPEPSAPESDIDFDAEPDKPEASKPEAGDHDGDESEPDEGDGGDMPTDDLSDVPDIGESDELTPDADGDIEGDEGEPSPDEAGDDDGEGLGDDMDDQQLPAGDGDTNDEAGTEGDSELPDMDMPQVEAAGGLDTQEADDEGMADGMGVGASAAEDETGEELGVIDGNGGWDNKPAFDETMGNNRADNPYAELTPSKNTAVQVVVRGKGRGSRG